MSNPTTPPSPVPARWLYLDHLRAALVILVVVLHAAVTYSGLGGWYYKEPAELLYPEFLGFAWLESHLQAFFMGLLFLIAGFFVPEAFDRKGASRFLRDRWFRLGWPSLFYVFVIHPLVTFLLQPIYRGDGQRPSFGEHYGHFLDQWRFLSCSGPLWFAIALFLFSAAYAGIRVTRGQRSLPSNKAPLPGHGIVVLYILVLGLITALVRVVQPVGTDILNMQLCFFSQYIALFWVGIQARRKDWIARLSTRFGLQWLGVGFVAGTPLWLAVLFGSKDNLDLLKGGWTWQSFGFALWDVLFGTAACLGLLVLFRDRLHRRYAWSDFLIRNAFSVYVFHTPVLIGITLALRSFHALPSVKFVVASTLAVIATYGLSEWAFRRIPGLRTIL